MKFTIKHESRGRMRVHMEQYRMTYEQADTLLYVIHNHRNVTFVKVYDRTADAVIEYVGDREQIIELLRHFHYESANVPQTVIKTSGRELNNSYQEKLIGSVVWHYSKKLLLPLPIRIALTIGRSVKYIGIGLKCLLQRKIEVPVLDATAITVSLITKDFSTASSIMFLLGIGELLEEWTHKKSVDDLARSMSLNVSKVWLKTPENQEILVESSKIEKGDKVVVHMGNVIPFDGEVLDGDAMVNQASLTGESVPVQRTVGNSVFAGTVVEEGEITIRVKEVEGNNRFDQIVTMIEESEKLKSELEGKAEHKPYQKKPPKEQPFQLLVDIQGKMAEGKSVGYKKWATKFNLKEMSKTLLFLQEQKISSAEELRERAAAATERYHAMGDFIKAAEARLTEIAVLKTHIINYAKTREVYTAYRKAGYSKAFLEAHREEITLHKAAKAAFDEAGMQKLPKVKELDAEFAELLTKKKAAYPDYRKARNEMQELVRAQKNVERFFAEEKGTTEKTQTRYEYSVCRHARL